MTLVAEPPGEASGSPRVTWDTPTLEHEQWLWASGYRYVAGVDEAGRGALAGPLVAAAVLFPPDPGVEAALHGLRDSKLLTAPARRAWLARIEELATGIGVAVIPAGLLDGVGLSAAGQLALCRAVDALPQPPDFILSDAFRLRATAAPQLALIHGDARCSTIAAASVVAKVVRDGLMDELHGRYPRYSFDRHKGYATAAHRAALSAHGPCPEHRRSYAPVRGELR
jgi:ribonuclease HII